MAEQPDTQPKPSSALETERYKANEAHILELLRATIAFEHAVLRPLPLLNGGAIVAVLTFAGHDRAFVDLQKLKCSLAVWAAGLVFGAIAISLGYLSQQSFLKAARRRRDAEEADRMGLDVYAAGQRLRHYRWDDWGNNWRIAAGACCALSLTLFIAGAFIALASLRP